MEKLFNEKVCAVCGKDFVVQDPGAYLYKLNDYKIRQAGHKKTPRLLYFCSYSCIRAYKKEKGMI